MLRHLNIAEKHFLMGKFSWTVSGRLEYGGEKSQLLLSLGIKAQVEIHIVIIAFWP